MPKPGKNGYKIAFATNTVVMNYKFAAAAAQYGTKENRIIRNIRHDFPGMAEIVVSGRERKSAAANTRLSYTNMEIHISAYENAAELLEVFKTVKALSKTCASPYKYVGDWFKAQFPDYRCAVGIDGEKAAVPLAAIPNTISYKKKDAADQLPQYPAADQKPS